MHTAFQIITGRAHIAQFLRHHDALILGRCGNLSLLGGDRFGIKIAQLGFTSGNIQPQLVVKRQRFIIKNVKAFDVFQQHMLVLEKIIRDLVNLALNRFKPRGELRSRGHAP